MMLDAATETGSMVVWKIRQIPVVCGRSLLILLHFSLAALCEVVSLPVVLQTPANAQSTLVCT